MNSPPILYDSHIHTPLCKHASGDPEAYAAVAQQRGLKGIIITCHNPAPNGWTPRVRMALEQFDQYLALVQRARNEWQGRIDVRLGLESDYIPGMEAWLEKLHARAPFHYILGSVHAHLSDYKALFWGNDVLEFQRTYFKHLTMAAESGLFDCLAHPDLIKIVFPLQWKPKLLLDDIRRSLDRIARTGIAMELNTSGLNKTYAEMQPGRFMLQEMKQRNIPVVVGSDAHKPERVAANFEQALELLQDVGYTQASFFLDRQRQTYDFGL